MNFKEILSQALPNVAIDAIYYFVRLLRHGRRLATIKSPLLAEGLDNEPSPEAQRLAKRLMIQAEREVQRSSGNFESPHINFLIKKMEKELLEIYTAGVPIDTARGDTLLEELRKTSKGTAA